MSNDGSSVPPTFWSDFVFDYCWAYCYSEDDGSVEWPGVMSNNGGDVPQTCWSERRSRIEMPVASVRHLTDHVAIAIRWWSALCRPFSITMVPLEGPAHIFTLPCGMWICPQLRGAHVLQIVDVERGQVGTPS